jgi:ketosteroid isomerase-like protein
MTVELEAADRAWQDALERRDVAAAGAILHDEYALVLVQPRPALVPRAAWLGLLPDYVVHEHIVQERFVDVDGDIAAILQRVYQHATVLGDDRSGVFVLSDLWRRVDGEWRVWRRHSTPLAAGVMPARA